MSLENVQFFGEVDRRDGRVDGPISAGYPGWWHRKQLAQDKEELAKKKRFLASGKCHPDAIDFETAECEAMERQIKKIEKSFPITKKNENEVYKLYKDCKGLLREALSNESHMNMRKGWVDAHTKVKHDKQPCVEVPKGYIKFFEKCLNCRVDGKGRVSRDSMAKAIKILGEGINQFKDGEEITNIEQIRPEGQHPAYQYEPTLQQVENGTN